MTEALRKKTCLSIKKPPYECILEQTSLLL